MLSLSIPFDVGAPIVVKNVHGYREREDYGGGATCVSAELTFNAYKLEVTMDDQGYAQ